ncbi:MAG: hypothetical protein MJ007_01920 [Paludibacteraceae bacterium]|nr:hypothetical protein [Paludibacteraceae bacterium]
MLDSITAGGVVSVLVIILSLIEITPVKFSPLQWIGKRVNAETIIRLDKVERKLDEHIAESYRNNILTVQDKLLKGERFTREEWEKALASCGAYKEYVKNNNLTNDVIDEAMKYIKHQYGLALDKADFVDLGVKA